MENLAKIAPVPPGRPVRLHLELKLENPDAEDQRILKRYAQSSTGTSLSRDILVPSDLTLHALHYAIQRLFGWQNGHLHAFELPEPVHAELTGGTVRGWFHLVGVLFRYNENHDDEYGDDDYQSGNFRTWLRRKYTGPYRYRSVSEDYAVAQRVIRGLIWHIPMVEIKPGIEWPEAKGKRSRRKWEAPRKKPVLDLTLKELLDSVMLETMPDKLLERLPVTDILASPATPLAGRAFVDSLPQTTYTREGAVHLDNPPVMPVTHKLIYHYDFGENWIVEITRCDDCEDLLADSHLTGAERAAAEATVLAEYRPVCVRQDGINVMDDVGNLGGFISFLESIYENPDDYENAGEYEDAGESEREASLAWAKEQGWSPRKTALKNVL